MELKLNSKHPDYHKTYYEQNKEKIIEGMNRPKWCEHCQKNIKFSRWTKHITAQKHVINENKNNVKIYKPNREIIIQLIEQLDNLKRKIINELSSDDLSNQQQKI
jgi:hypothetical protein